MTGFPRALPGALGLLLAGGCAQPPAPPADRPTDPASLRAECGALPRESATACYDAALLGMLEREGVAPTMAALERLAAEDAAVRSDGHLFAHSIGLASLRGGGEVGATFEECTPSFQSGCYHGVIQSYFAGLTSGAGTAGVGAEPVNALCADWRGDPEKRWLLFQCAHGLGHGLALVHDQHLPSVLAGCDLLTVPWEREGCYGGAFMENIVQATAPHHGVGRPDGAGAADPHAGHDMGAAAADPHAGHDMGAAPPDPHAVHDMAAAPREPFPALDPDDPLYPCNVLAARYQPACYQMQTSAILFQNGGDVPAAARACDSAPEAHRVACYQSLGRDVSAYTLQDHPRAIALCSAGDPAYRAWCHVGYTKNLVDLTARPDDALAYCRALPDAPDKRACYEAVGEQLWVLTADPGARRTACEGAEAEYRGVCATAAGVGRI